MPDISAALVLLRKPIETVIEAATGKGKETVAKLKAPTALKGLYGKLNATQKVKSIWNVDRAIAISSFYYPARITTRTGASQQLTCLDELPSNNVVLCGTVGQGKSILLRHLLGKEIRSGERVPVFVELRRTPQGVPLETYIHQEFDQLLQPQGSPTIFELFAKNGRVSVLLDGFDEIGPDRVQEFASAIERLAQRYPSIRIVVTSRPNSAIESSPLFDVIPVSPLQSADLPGFFHKVLSKDKELAHRLTVAVKKSKAVEQLASTPLLATLLAIIYRAHRRIPANFTEFYEELFQILLVRHDRAKGGYERRRRTRLGDRDIQLVFEAFCYKTRADGTSSLSRSRAADLAAFSAETQQLECDAEAFLQDIIKVTCLLQEEGGQIEFLHQSVQEFFAARYIAARPEEVAQRFYSLATDPPKWQQWEQVVRFLDQIDQYRSSKHFFVPVLTRSLQQLDSISPTPKLETLRSLIACSSGVRQARVSADPLAPPRYFIHLQAQTPIYRLEVVRHELFERLFRSRPPLDWKSCFDGSTDGEFVSYYDIAKKLGQLDRLDAALLGGVKKVREDLAAHERRIDTLNRSSDFMGIL